MRDGEGWWYEGLGMGMITDEGRGMWDGMRD